MLLPAAPALRMKNRLDKADRRIERAALAVRGAAFAVAFGASFFAACGAATDGPSRSGSRGSAATGGTTTGGGGESGSSAGSSGSGAATGTGGIDLPPEDAGTFEPCEAEESVARGVGLDIYLVLDRTASMTQGPGEEPTPPAEGDCALDLSAPPSVDSKWCLATHALASFFTAQMERDVRVAFQFMNPDENGDICGPVMENPHATPAADFRPLPIEEDDELLTAIEDTVPSVTATRIEGALNGLALFTAASAAPPRRMIGILITDGDPSNSGVGTACNTVVEEIATIPQAHYEATGIPTFIIGMTGATAANLQTLAVAGGGPEHGPDEFCEAPDDTCNYWSVGDGDPEALVSALEGIQDAAIPCEYELPESSQTNRIDPELVQAKYTPSDDAEAEEFERVDGLDACGDAGGWYYDDNEEPNTIHLCPTSCELVTSAVSGSKVVLAYGCRPDVL